MRSKVLRENSGDRNVHCNEMEEWRNPATALCPMPGREGTQRALGMQEDGAGYPRARQKALVAMESANRAREAQRTKITYLTACGRPMLLSKSHYCHREKAAENEKSWVRRGEGV